MDISGLAIDLGGTKCSGAIISGDRGIVSRKIVNIAGQEGSAVEREIGKLIGSLKRQASELGSQIKGLCISVPGIVYQTSGNVWAPNIAGWEDYPLKRSLEKDTDFDFPIFVDNDRACGILGEVWKGSAKGCSNAIYLAVGTGIGAGIYSDGRIIRGSGDIAGAIGWMALDSDYKPGYEQFGSFEYNASGNGLARVAHDLLSSSSEWDNSILRKHEKPDARIIFEAFRQEDPLAVYVIENAIQYWSKAIANLVSIFNPEVIILGGGVFGPGLALLDRIFECAKKWAQPVSIGNVKLVPSLLGSDSVLFGAGKIAIEAGIQT